MPSPSSIHDLLSIGEIEAALASNEDMDAEIDRLPLLLRLLATGQPLSAVPHLMPHSHVLNTDQTSDPFVNAVVSKLEDVAATHSAAESIDVLVNHLAPSISRRISRLEPLKRKAPDQWSTSELAATALAPLSHVRSKKSRLHPIQRDSMCSHESDDNLEEGSGDEMEDVSGNVKMQETPSEVVLLNSYEALKRRRSDGGRDSFLAGMPEDSADAHLTRVLSEVASLVVESLQPPLPAPKEEQEETPPERILSVKADSLLSESDTTMSGGNDLAACLSALMHHAPVLRHRHVASAFCRASVPQASTLIYLMGANSPSAVACLVRGCMDAVTTEGATESIIAIAKEAVRRLAKLSPREAARIQGVLQSAMLDVQLELALEHDTVTAACLLIRFLAKGESLRCLLLANSPLVSKCYSCLLSQIDASEKNSGEMKVLLRALTWLVRSIVGAKTKVLLDAATTLASTLMKYSLDDDKESKPQTSYNDPAILLALSSSLLLCSVLALNGGQGVEDEGMRKDEWQNLLKALLVSFNPPSIMTEVHLSRIAVLLHSQDITLLHEMVQETLSSQAPSVDDDNLQDGFLKLCKWAVIKGNLDTLSNRTLTPTAVVLDPTALLHMIAANYIEVAQLKFIMQDILSSSIAGSALVRHDRVNDLLTAAINFISRSDKQDVPLVSQTMLSRLIRKATTKVEGEASAALVLHMVLNFAYTVIFFDENPTSPFSFDPRDQPVGEVLRLMKQLDLGSVYTHVTSILLKHVPDIVHDSVFMNPSMTTLLEVSNESLLNNTDITRLLSAAIREALRRPDADPSGLRVERTFLLAQRHLPSFEVDCLTVRNLMALPNSPPPFLTYGMLRRDPLLVLQFPLSMWQCRGIRRVALSILGRLLPANENFTRQASPSEEVADELITSRNVIVLRCFLSLATGYTLSDDANSSFRLTNACQCHVLTGAIRSLVASHSGLISIIIKHGLPDEVVDWLVDFVPECINDAFALTMLLSERCPLTAAERLKTADAALRIAIAFGSRDELEAKNLVGACLHQLISSFYLVLGPVGVPVNALIEENGMDLTQVCRKATFRILNALQKVRASRTGLKSECSLALQKLASLCKGETGMTGVAGVVANQRKTLLKEIWDALVKALNGMGSGISLN